MWSAQIRSQAISLRNNGLSLNQIIGLLKLPKTTVYGWVGHINRPSKITRQGRRELMKLYQPLAA